MYVDGVPVFFDHHIPFGNEADHRSLAGFLTPGPDGGYASQWRLRELGQAEDLRPGAEDPRLVDEGLSNIEQRLRRYGNTETPLVIRSTPGMGTTVEIRIPIQATEMATLAGSTKSS